MSCGRVFELSALALVLLGSFSVRSSFAATLDDASIRALYAEEEKLDEEADKTKDAKKIQAFLEKYLDDTFTVTTNTEDTVGDDPPQKDQETHSKAETLVNVADNMKLTDVLSSEEKVTGITYSDDHKYAYVTTTSASTGVIKGPEPDGKLVKLGYQDGMACIEKLTLKNAAIKIMQAACNDKTATKEQSK